MVMLTFTQRYDQVLTGRISHRNNLVLKREHDN